MDMNAGTTPKKIDILPLNVFDLQPGHISFLRCTDMTEHDVALRVLYIAKAHYTKAPNISNVSQDVTS